MRADGIWLKGGVVGMSAIEAGDLVKLGIAGFVFLALFYYAQQLISNASGFFADSGFAQAIGIGTLVGSFIVAGLFVKWVSKWF